MKLMHQMIRCSADVKLWMESIGRIKLLREQEKIFIYNIKGKRMNKNFNIEFIAVAAERIAEFAERVFAITDSVHRFK